MTKRKKTLICLVALVATASAIVVVVSPWISPRNTSKIKLAWTHGGRPMTIEGTVKDDSGHPLAGKTVIVGTNSGNESAETDNDGKFSIVFPENQIVNVTVNGHSSIKWPLNWGPDVRKGLLLDITLHGEALTCQPTSAPASDGVKTSLREGRLKVSWEYGFSKQRVEVYLCDAHNKPLALRKFTLHFSDSTSWTCKTDGEGRIHIVANIPVKLQTIDLDNVGSLSWPTLAPLNLQDGIGMIVTVYDP